MSNIEISNNYIETLATFFANNGTISKWEQAIIFSTLYWEKKWAWDPLYKQLTAVSLLYKILDDKKIDKNHITETRQINPSSN